MTLNEIVNEYMSLLPFDNSNNLKKILEEEISLDEISKINKKVITCFENRKKDDRIFVSPIELFFWKKWRRLKIRKDCITKYCGFLFNPHYENELKVMNEVIENHIKTKNIVPKLNKIVDENMNKNNVDEQLKISSGVHLNFSMYEISDRNHSITGLKESVCPFCKSINNHITKVDNNFCGKNDDYQNDSRYRQGNITIHFECESNPKLHKWQITFGEHKGCIYAEIFKSSTPNCIQSPIEKKLYESLLQVEEKIKITPQFCIDRYRVDFLIEHRSKKIIVECDGHDFHEKTKEQASYDKKRDRFLISKGYTVLHFTGSELHKNVNECVNEILKFL